MRQELGDRDEADEEAFRSNLTKLDARSQTNYNYLAILVFSIATGCTLGWAALIVGPLLNSVSWQALAVTLFMLYCAFQFEMRAGRGGYGGPVTYMLRRMFFHEMERVVFVKWADIPHHGDLRSDVNAMGDIKHAEARYMEVDFINYHGVRRVVVSGELLTQLTSQNVLTLNSTSEQIWDRICHVAKSDNGTNVDRSLVVAGKPVVQNTCWAAMIVAADMRREFATHSRPQFPAF